MSQPPPVRPGGLRLGLRANNLNGGLAWGLLPLLFVRGGLPVGQVGLLAALSPAVWGLGQLLTGPLSDWVGRKPLFTGGMLLQAIALAGTASDLVVAGRMYETRPAMARA